MEAPDKITVSLKNNPDLAAKFAGSAPGDSVKLDGVELTIDEIAEDLLTASINDIDKVDITAQEPDDTGSEVDADSPVMQVMGGKKY